MSSFVVSTKAPRKVPINQVRVRDQAEVPKAKVPKAKVPAKGSKVPKPRRLPLDQRQFYHSKTGQPMTLEEVLSDRDSDNESDSETEAPDLTIADSMDDKEVMEKFIQAWNWFAKKNRVLADSHIPWAFEKFTRLYKKELHNNLRIDMCWRLFMIKHWDFGIFDAVTMNKCNTMIKNYSPNADIDVDENDHMNTNNEENKGTMCAVCRNSENDEMNVEVEAVEKEPSQAVDKTTPFDRSAGKRPIKQTFKMQEIIKMTQAKKLKRGSSSSKRGRGGRLCRCPRPGGRGTSSRNI
ncbi:hypothetical protein CARUB_v10006259mg [Capsella rubella]|uniref:Polycomb protein VEFS-Box domain-containing protein n=1 Tax=Capsella rubella TaxID=81985 RepID=R0GLU8_9BRAS|nr:polycomb group protein VERNALIZATION 2 [Capsella rubella]EOA17854.1 hypothetical protein CARUB_v10006259mg [Capsella rubella]